MTQPLDAQTTKAFMQAALENAHALLEDAGVLITYERWARAHSLAVAAMEEICKAVLAREDITIAKGRKWPRGRPGHNDKLLAARQYYSLVVMLQDRNEINLNEWFADQHDFEAEHDWEVRQSGLYVDVYQGVVVGGHSSMSEEVAVGTVAFTNEVVHRCMGPLWRASESLTEKSDESEEDDVPF